jgi:hypothetical protein
MVRATRAVFGAFGAGVSLAIAGSLALLVVSSVIAFRGWPDLTASPEAQSVELSQSAPGLGAPTTSVKLPSAADPVSTSRTRGHSATHGGAQSSTKGAGGQRTAAGTLPATSGETATGDSGQPSKNPVDDKADPVKTVSDAVRDTTKGVAVAVTPVAPAVGGALQSIGAAGADTVDQAGDTVKGVVDSVIGG